MPSIDVPIIASLDDGSVYGLNTDNPSMYSTDSSTPAGNHPTSGFIGSYLRFFLNIPKFATISNAYLVLHARSSGTLEVVRTSISCEDIANSPQITSGVDFKYRLRTLPVYWDNIGPWSSLQPYQSPSFPEQVQVIVNKPDYMPGNVITVFWEDLEFRSDVGAYRNACSIDYAINKANPSLTPVLHIDYEIKPIVAIFSADPISGGEPLAVNFSDESIGIIHSWLWDFGDGTTSIEQNPVHTFSLLVGQSEHSFVVTLTVSGPEGQGSAQLVITVFGVVTPVIPESTFYWTPAELEQLRLLATQSSHQEIWRELSAWAEAHVNDPPPAEPVGGDYRPVVASIRIYINNMGFMAAMTEDIRYVEAAIPWVLSALTWTTWDRSYPDFGGQVRAWMGIAVSTGYNFFRASLTPQQRTDIINRLAYEIGELNYDYYKDWGYIFEQWPAAKARFSSGLVFAGLAIVDDYPQAQSWLDFGILHIGNTLKFYHTDGGFGAGGSYVFSSLLHLIPCIDALRRMRGLNLYDARLENLPYFNIYMNYNHGPLQMEDCGWYMGYNRNYPWEISCFYRLASEYNNSYAQWFADFYSIKGDMHTFLWKDPAIQPRSPSDLPLTRHFDSVGYVLSRTGWGNNDLLFAFKSGVSYKTYGHSHNSQNQFQVYNKGVPLTCGPGWLPYARTASHNCILLGDDFGQDETPGRIILVEARDPYYNYVSGEASQAYSGRLTRCLRQVVVLTNPAYTVIYDQVVANAPEQITWQITAPYTPRLTPGAGGTPLVKPAAISMSGNTITITQRNSGILATLTNVIVEPDVFISEKLPLAAQFSSERVKVYPPNPVTEAQFLNVQFPDAALATEKVNVGNAIGVIVRDGYYLDLIIFSTDGAPVDQYIELGATYQPNDGQFYEFDGTRVRANFNTYQVMRLQEAAAPLVTLTISATPGGTTEPAPGTWNYDQGSTATLTALPSAGYQFVEWQEAGSRISVENLINIVMDVDRSLTAIFEEIVVPPEEFALTISVLGEGTTEPAPGAYTVPEGQSITVVATPGSGYRFDHWEGDISGTRPTAIFIVNSNMSIVAVFTEAPSVVPLFAAGAAVLTLLAVIGALIARRRT